MKKIFLIISLLLVITSCNKENTENRASVGNMDNQVKNEQNVFTGKTDTGVILDTGIVSSGTISDETNIDNKIVPSTKVITNTGTITTKLENNNSFSKEEIAKHNKKEDSYTIIYGKVYNITSFFGKHPGGDANILKLCGIDGTEFFTNNHGENEKAIMTRDTFYMKFKITLVLLKVLYN